jgi:hypothetical protein
MGLTGNAGIRYCRGCSHPTICKTHGCAAEEARFNRLKEETKEPFAWMTLADAIAFRDSGYTEAGKVYSVPPDVELQCVPLYLRAEDLQILKNNR